MFSSVAAGASNLDKETKAFWVLPVDIPLVRPASIRELLQAFPMIQMEIADRRSPAAAAIRHLSVEIMSASFLTGAKRAGGAALLTRFRRVMPSMWTWSTYLSTGTWIDPRRLPAPGFICYSNAVRLLGGVDALRC